MTKNITNSKLLGGWSLILEKANKLPQDLASATSRLFDSAKLGGSYLPVYYVGTQLVNGTNHKLIVERTKQVSGGKTIKDFAIVTINIPVGDIKAQKAFIVSEEDATDFVLRDDIEKGVKKAFADFIGTIHKPILELGSHVDNGTNYHFICESKAVYPNAEPYLTRIVIKNFQDSWSIEEIQKI